MKKAELVSAVAEKAGLSKQDSEKAVNALVNVVKEAIVSGDKVTLVGLGTFGAKERAERQGFNPQTKEKIVIPAARVPEFKAAKALKEEVAK